MRRGRHIELRFGAGQVQADRAGAGDIGAVQQAVGRVTFERLGKNSAAIRPELGRTGARAGADRDQRVGLCRKRCRYDAAGRLRCGLQHAAAGVAQRGDRVGDIGCGVVGQRLLERQAQVVGLDRLLLGVDCQCADAVLIQPAAQQVELCRSGKRPGDQARGDQRRAHRAAAQLHAVRPARRGVGVQRAVDAAADAPGRNLGRAAHGQGEHLVQCARVQLVKQFINLHNRPPPLSVCRAAGPARGPAAP